MYLKAFLFLYLARTVIVHHVVCAVITEALWKGSKTVRRAAWNSRLQPEQHSDQQRAVSCSAASGYSCHIPVGSDKHFHSTSLKTELRGGDYGLEGRKNIRSGSRSSFSLVCSAPLPVTLRDLGGELLVHVHTQRFPPTKGRPPQTARLPGGGDLVMF